MNFLRVGTVDPTGMDLPGTGTEARGFPTLFLRALLGNIYSGYLSLIQAAML